MQAQQQSNPAYSVKKNVALFLHHPICSTASVNGVVRALSATYDLKIFTQDQVRAGFFDDVDLVIFPGGDGDTDKFHNALEENAAEIKRFLRRGGKYLGLGTGAYWADEDYLGALKETRVQQYIKQQGADIRASFGTTLPVDWQGRKERMFFYDGPTFIGGQFETIASYGNGDPMAIIQGNIGLVGCNLESEAFWYDKKIMQLYWHGGAQHRLLLQFIANYLLSEPQLALF